ncbi:MAG: hypothetical protein WCW27_02545 [Patescibacteria group bacterium]|jgi:hypothetical protein
MKYETKPISAILRSNNTVFTFKDVALIWGNTNKITTISSVNYYIKTGQLYRIRKGIYAKNEHYNKLEFATKLYPPAYISLETVLRQTGVIFQYYSQIFVVSYLTRQLEVDKQKYVYRRIKEQILTNQLGLVKKDNYFIADKERAFLDMLYLRKNFSFDNLSSINWASCFVIAKIYENKTLIKKLNSYYKDYKYVRT